MFGNATNNGCLNNNTSGVLRINRKTKKACLFNGNAFEKSQIIITLPGEKICTSLVWQEW